MRGYYPDWREEIGPEIRWPTRVTDRWIRNLNDDDLLIVRDVFREENAQVQDEASFSRWQRVYSECERRGLLAVRAV